MKAKKEIEKRLQKKAVSDPNIKNLEKSLKLKIDRLTGSSFDSVHKVFEDQENQVVQSEIIRNLAIDFQWVQKSNLDILFVNEKICTMQAAIKFKKVLMKKVLSSPSKLYIIDLSKAELVDSTFFGVMVLAVKKISAQNGEIKLVCSDRFPSVVMLINSIGRVFQIYKNIDEALDSNKTS